MNTTSDNASSPTPAPQMPQTIREIDPVKVQAFEEQLRSEQSLFVGIAAGGLAALLGSILWAVITVVTQYQIGWMAVGIAFLIGWTIRFFGRGIDKVFGFVGAGLALLSCLAGNFFMIAALIAQEESMSVLEVLGLMLLNPAVDLELMISTFSPIDLLFYALALYYGYKYSFRVVTPQERDALYRTRTLVP